MQDMNEKFNKTDFEKKKTLRFWEWRALEVRQKIKLKASTTAYIKWKKEYHIKN
jgi:hypothetical protein